MGNATDLDLLSKACEAGSEEACELLRRKRMAGFKDGGLLADASRTWKMESDYPEFEKGVANRLSKERIPEAEVEEQFQYSPLQRGYAEGGEVENFMDETGSLLQPEVPLDFEDEMGGEMMMGDDMMEDEEEILDGLSPEDQEILYQALSDYPELEEILNTLTANDSVPDVFDEEGSVEGPGTGTSDSIPANLSDGEFVFTAKAVKQLGVDKLRKMMAKAEEDYDEGDAEQMFAQMGDEGFAAGGLLTKDENYAGGGKVSKGGKIRTLDLGYGGPTFTHGQIMKMRKTFGEGFMKRVFSTGQNRFGVKGFKHGGLLEYYKSDFPPGSYATEDEGTETGELTPGIGKGERRKKQGERRKKLGTMLFKLLGLDPVIFTHPSKVPSGKRSIDRESAFLERV